MSEPMHISHDCGPAAEALLAGRAVLFFGSAISVVPPTDLPLTSDIVGPIAQLLARGDARVESLLNVVQPEQLFSILAKALGPGDLGPLEVLVPERLGRAAVPPNYLHMVVAALAHRCGQPVFTTNFDEFVEEAGLRRCGRAEASDPREMGACVVKLHGTISDPSTMIFRVEDVAGGLAPAYERALRWYLARFEVVFVGYSGLDMDVFDTVVSGAAHRIHWVVHPDEEARFGSWSPGAPARLCDPQQPSRLHMLSTALRQRPGSPALHVVPVDQACLFDVLGRRLGVRCGATPRAGDYRERSRDHVSAWTGRLPRALRDRITGRILLSIGVGEGVLQFVDALSQDVEATLQALHTAGRFRQMAKYACASVSAHEALVTARRGADCPARRKYASRELLLARGLRQAWVAEARRMSCYPAGLASSGIYLALAAPSLLRAFVGFRRAAADTQWSVLSPNDPGARADDGTELARQVHFNARLRAVGMLSQLALRPMVCALAGPWVLPWVAKEAESLRTLGRQYGRPDIDACAARYEARVRQSAPDAPDGPASPRTTFHLLRRGTGFGSATADVGDELRRSGDHRAALGHYIAARADADLIGDTTLALRAAVRAAECARVLGDDDARQVSLSWAIEAAGRAEGLLFGLMRGGLRLTRWWHNAWPLTARP